MKVQSVMSIMKVQYINNQITCKTFLLFYENNKKKPCLASLTIIRTEKNEEFESKL